MATINDVVLIHLEDEPVSFARVEDINPDHKKDWYQIKLLMLQLPLQTVTWILKDDYINGGEFTMGGRKMRLEKVECPEEDPIMEALEDPIQDEITVIEEQDHAQEEDAASGEENGQVISFKDLQKRKNAPKG